MKRIPVGLALALLPLAWSVPPALAQAPEPLPPTVANSLKEFTDLCREVDGKPDAGQAITKVDLNADGRTDYVLDVAGIQCEGAWSVFGDRAKAVMVFAGDGKGGATAAFSDTTFGSKVEGSGNDARLWLTVYAEMCGKPPAADFASESFCDRPLVWNAAKGAFEYAPVGMVRMIE